MSEGLVKAGFLAIFLGPADMAPPTVVIVLFRWLLFRVELGAGLIKLRGDPCWRDLTCLDFHHETHIHPFLPDTSGSASGSITCGRMFAMRLFAAVRLADSGSSKKALSAFSAWASASASRNCAPRR